MKLQSLVLSALSLWIPLSACKAEDSPQFRGPNRDGKSTETGLWQGIRNKQKPELLWTAEGVGSGYGSVAVVKDRVFTSGNTDKGQAISALSVADGKIIWSTPITAEAPKHDYQGSRTTPTFDGNYVYAVSSGGSLACLQASDGKLVWSRDFKDWNGKMMSGWGYSESPLVDGDLVLCTPGGDKGMVVALNKKTGETVWSAVLPADGQDKNRKGAQLNDGAGYASIVVSNGGGVKQYVQLVGKGFIGIRARDGKVLWHYTGVANNVANIPTVLVDGDFVFCSTAYDTGSALLKLTASDKDEVKMTEVYTLDAGEMQNKHGGMILVDGYIYCGTGNGNGLPLCVKLSDGKKAWGPARAAGNGESSVTYADGVLVFRRQSGDVDFIEATPTKFNQLMTFKPEFQEGDTWAYPVISGGKLYLREQNKVMCYKLK